MKNLIVFYSKTGNTRGIAEKIKEKINADIDEIKALSDDPNQTYVELKHSPSLEGYDHIIFGSPVHGFMPPKITKAYIESLEDLSQKTFDLFVTHFFPFSWLGGTQTLKRIKKEIEAKGGKIRFEFSINWKSKKKDLTIQDMLEKLSK